jgi:2-C-methyl-D-erythritol 4-phosphate cytidylyltransferase
VILPAAGGSNRFSDGDKLATDLGGRPLLLRTVEVFSRRGEVVQIIVAGPAGEMDRFNDRFGAALAFHGVQVVEGGRIDRWESVRNALALVDEACTHVAVHDAARPLVNDDLLDRLFSAAETLEAVIPVLSMTSTLKEVDPDLRVDAGEEDDLVVDSILGDAGRLEVNATKIIGTVDRRCYGQAQTPQIFTSTLLRRAYAADDLTGVTDDAQVVERLGEAVHAIEGDPTNLKITTVEDLQLASAIMSLQPPRRPRDPLMDR